MGTKLGWYLSNKIKPHFHITTLHKYIHVHCIARVKVIHKEVYGCYVVVVFNVVAKVPLQSCSSVFPALIHSLTVLFIYYYNFIIIVWSISQSHIVHCVYDRQNSFHKCQLFAPIIVGNIIIC